MGNKIALIGTGLMGTAIAEKLFSAGHNIVVYNRTESKTASLKEKGITVLSTARAAIEQAECVILTLSEKKAIEEVLSFGDYDMEGKTFIQMGTISPSESIELQKKFFQASAQYLECPVLGSKKQVLEGMLIIMVGTTKEKYDKWHDLLKILGEDIYFIGEVGKASAIKLALNQLIISHAVNFSLSLGIVDKNGIDQDIFSDILRKSALYAPMYDKKLANWSNRDFSNPNFPIRHMLKDVNLILDEVEDKGLNDVSIQAVKEMLEKAVDSKLGDKDYSAIFEIVNNDNS